MNYLGSERTVIQPFSLDKIGETVQGKVGDPIQLFQKAKVTKVIRKFNNDVDTIDQDEFQKHQIEWQQQDGYHVKSCTGKDFIVSREELAGNQIWLSLKEEEQTVELYFAHIGEVFVQEGEEITSGTIVGTEGNTGLMSGTQENGGINYPSLVRFSAYENGLAIDPRAYAFQPVQEVTPFSQQKEEQCKEEPTLLFTCFKDGTYYVRLRQGEQLYLKKKNS